MADTTPQARSGEGPRGEGPPGELPAGGSPVPGTGGTAVQTEPSSPVEREFTVAARTQTQMVIRRFLAHRLAVASLVIFVIIVAGSLGGARLWKYNYADITREFSTPPSLAHPFGTDDIGHDTLAQVLRGAQKSVQVALVVALLATSFGAVLGAVAGYYRGVIDSLLMRFTDLVETALTFLGLVIRPADTSLGLLVSTGQQAAQTRPWLFYFPGLVIIMIALTINFIGDGLRDAFDPTQT